MTYRNRSAERSIESQQSHYIQDFLVIEHGINHPSVHRRSNQTEEEVAESASGGDDALYPSLAQLSDSSIHQVEVLNVSRAEPARRESR